MFDSYIKLASKSSVITLERVLKSDELWARKKLKMAELFAVHEGAEDVVVRQQPHDLGEVARREKRLRLK